MEQSSEWSRKSPALMATPAAEESHTAQLQAGRNIEYISIAWTSFEAAIGIAAGLFAGSVVLIGFGIDSVIEVASSTVLLWRLNAHLGEEREKIAHRLVGIGFLALAVYISYIALRVLI